MAECPIMRYGDGSWVCTECQCGGDMDEDPEDYCPNKQENKRAEKDSKPSRR